MKLPSLNPSSRTREWDSYDFNDRSEIVREWLFSSERGHREIDRDILKLDHAYTKGFQSMGVLHFLGLKKEFKGIFEGMKSSEAIKIMESDPQDFSAVIEFVSREDNIEKILQKKVYSNSKQSLDKFRKSLDRMEQTDGSSTVSVGRKEQALLRYHLFGNQEKIKCALCHKDLPINIMIAAHIKPRRYCSHKERIDLNIVMPACKLGCDDLFEKGYVIIDSKGFIKTNLHETYSPDLAKYVEQYRGKQCTFHNKDTAKYFKEKNRILNKDH